MQEKKTFYITTPIYYPSDKLHIGHSYTTVLRYESEPIVRIPISAITCPVGAARIATTTPHGMLDGWRGTVVNVQQPKEINAEDANNIRSSEYHSATVIDTSTVEFNDFWTRLEA